MSELTPCPFCGGAYREISNHSENCYLKMLSDNFRAFATNDESFQHAEEEMTEAWNTRYEKTFQFQDLDDIEKWALENLEGCDEPEWTLLIRIADSIADYKREVISND